MRRSLSSALVSALPALGACAGGWGPEPKGSGPPGNGPIGELSRLALVSAVPGDGSVRLEWVAEDEQGGVLSVALFQGADRASVYAGAPLAVDPPGDSLELAGLANGDVRFFGLALQRSPGEFEAAGPVLRVRAGAPIYVDPLADPSVADGRAPSTAFPDPLSAILTALARGGGNVWLRGGDYGALSLPLFASVDLYGGFGAAFDLATRDAELFPSILRGASAGTILEAQGGEPGSIVDGLVLDGGEAAVTGIEAQDTPLELRGVVARSCVNRGCKLSSSLADRALEATLVRCRLLDHGGDGLFVQGAWSLAIDGSEFSGNGHEGAELEALQAPDGVRATLAVRGSRFVRNGSTGLDVELGPQPFPGALGSLFDVSLSGSSFEENGGDGLRLDLDFELDPLCTAELLLRGLLARANAGSGVQLDLDASASTFVHRLLASANGGDGLGVTSESAPGFLSVSASAAAANQGAGLRASVGSVSLLASHCVVAGNRGGGLVSGTVDAGAVSCAAWLQPSAWSGAWAHRSISAADASAPLFAAAPREYRSALAASGSSVTLDDLGTLANGERVELADDGVPRTIRSIAGGAIAVDPAAGGVRFPASLAAFAGGVGPREDYRPGHGSALLGAGMSAPGAPLADAGVFGSPAGGEPGREDLSPAPLFRAARSAASLSSQLAPSQPIEIAFAGGTLDPASLDPTRVRVLLESSQAALAAQLGTTPFGLRVDPPLAGWPAGEALVLELHAGLRSLDGVELAAPLAIPLRVQ